MRQILGLAFKVDEYWNQEKPRVLAKDPAQSEHLQRVCSTNLNLFRLLTLYLKPVLPRLAENVERFLNIPPLAWKDAASTLTDRAINPYQHLATRIDPKAIEAMLDASKESLKMTTETPPVAAP